MSCRSSTLLSRDVWPCVSFGGGCRGSLTLLFTWLGDICPERHYVKWTKKRFCIPTEGLFARIVSKTIFGEVGGWVGGCVGGGVWGGGEVRNWGAREWGWRGWGGWGGGRGWEVVGGGCGGGSVRGGWTWIHCFGSRVGAISVYFCSSSYPTNQYLLGSW